MVGRLTLDAFFHGPVVLVGQLSMVFGGLAAAGLITYLKRWKWLWREWITTTNHKRIGVMYIIVALLM